MPLQRDDKPPPPDMTEQAAAAEAKRRWGPAGAVWTTPRDGGGLWKHVGTVETFPIIHHVAVGVAGRWDRAFRDADLNEARRIEQHQGRNGGLNKRNGTRRGARRRQRQ